MTSNAGELEELANDIQKIFCAKNKTLAVVESCTGGLLAKTITDVPGSSQYFLGGVIAYSNDVKIEIAGVNLQTILDHGAVSSETAIELASSAQIMFGADAVIGVTGVAGPDGGTDEKPVGLVFVAVDCGGEVACERYEFAGSRGEVREQAVVSALRLLETCAGKF